MSSAKALKKKISKRAKQKRNILVKNSIRLKEKAAAHNLVTETTETEISVNENSAAQSILTQETPANKVPEQP